MTSPQTGAEPASPERGSTPGTECDPDLLDDLKCRAVGIQAQADYNKAHEDELTAARAQYDGARSAYGAARSAAQPDVDDLGKQLAQVIDQLRCLVDDESETGLLDRAFGQVELRLQECGPREGCTFTDECDFDSTVQDCRPEDIPSAIAHIERRTAAAAAVFADLIAEPVDLAKRVADLKTETESIKTKMASDSRTVDFVMLYAAALVARDHQENIWHGFAHVNAYVDCLCRTLMCQIKGYAAISELKRREAVHQCHQERHAAACTRLHEHTADEVYAEYLRLQAEPQRQPEPQPQQAGPGGRERERAPGRAGYEERGRY
jgi:hypothetical protein